MTEAILILTHCPDYDCAQSLAKTLVKQRLAACVNIGTQVTSIYSWHEKLEQTQEIPLLIKTQKDCYARVESCIRKSHPYEVPEIIAIAIVDGLASYLQWINHTVQENISDQLQLEV